MNIRPVEYKVLVLPIEVKRFSPGGIELPETAIDKEKFAKSEGTIVAVGAIAFTDPNWLDCPKVGDRVLFDRYAGSLVKDADGIEYRLINDKEIGAVVA